MRLEAVLEIWEGGHRGSESSQGERSEMGRMGEGICGGRGGVGLLDKLIVGGGFNWEGGVVVQMEDDTKKEVGTVPGEGTRVLDREPASAS